MKMRAKPTIWGKAFVIAALSASAMHGSAAPAVRTDANRNATPLNVGFRRLGTLRQRDAREVGPANWTIDSSCVDRDFVDFDKYCQYLPPLGVAKIRVMTGWAKSERVRGVYDVAWLDHIVDWCLGHGILPILELSYGNPAYPGAGGAGLKDGIPSSPEGLDAWDRWVDFLGSHYKGRIDEWAMWNEPDINKSGINTPETVAAFNVRSAKILRRHMPKCVLHGLSLAGFGWVMPCVRAMGEDAKMFDTLVYHGYSFNPDASYAEVEKLRSELQAVLPNARLRQGENGTGSEWLDRFALKRHPWSEVSQAKWDMRRMLGDLGHDVESGLFCIADINYGPPTFPTFFCNRKGYLRLNASNDVVRVKRAYYAVQNTVSVFDSTVRRVRENPRAACTDRTVSLYEYEAKNGSPILAFWYHGPVTVRSTADTFVEDQNVSVLIDPKAKPGDSFETRGVAFTWSGRKFVDPVWVDLMTGWVFELPAELQIEHSCGIDFADIPVYDSPCLLTERSAVSFL